MQDGCLAFLLSDLNASAAFILTSSTLSINIALLSINLGPNNVWFLVAGAAIS